MNNKTTKNLDKSLTKPSESYMKSQQDEQTGQTVPSWSPDLQSRIRVAFSSFPDERLYSMARSVAMHFPEHWDDIVQEGRIFLLKSAESWDGRQEFGQFAYKLLRMSMMREGTKWRASMRGVAVCRLEAKTAGPDRRVRLRDIATSDGKMDANDRLTEMAVYEETPEDTVMRQEAKWEIRRAAWTVAENMKAHESTWKYQILRDAILSDRKTAKEIANRFNKFPGSVYFFVNNFHKKMRIELGVTND